METLNTNLLVRLVLGDDLRQAELAAVVWRRAVGAGGVFLPKVVLVELTWVLGALAGFDRERIANELRRLLAMQGVTTEDSAVMQRAIDRYETGSADFADYVILESGRENGALPVRTFDRRFARERDVILAEASETAP